MTPGQFVIEDSEHCEQSGSFATLEDAISELRRRATIPWHDEPNAAPCVSWKTCGRKYGIVEWDSEASRERRRTPYLEISARGVMWLVPPDSAPART